MKIPFIGNNSTYKYLSSLLTFILP